jgi:transcriptional regulator with GAF, ATPase, and Fis domain
MITLDCLPPEIAVGLGTPTASVTSHNEATIIADRPSMDELQRRYLQLVLDENQGKKRRAAAVLGLDRRTVQRLVAKYRLLASAEGDNEDPADPEIPQDEDGGNP